MAGWRKGSGAAIGGPSQAGRVPLSDVSIRPVRDGAERAEWNRLADAHRHRHRDRVFVNVRSDVCATLIRDLLPAMWLRVNGPDLEPDSGASRPRRVNP